MKKILFAATLAMAGVTVQAQQIQGEFDEAWENCVPYNGGANTKNYGTQPQGWTVANVCGISTLNGMGNTVVASQVTGNNSTAAVKLTNTANQYMSSQIVPGYMALGVTWNTSVTGKSNDGGTFGGKDFAYRPDAIEFYYKRSAQSGNESIPSKVIAYLWSGSWSQATVPVNIAFNTSSLKKVTMVDRDRNILGLECAQGGAVTSNSGKLIAQLDASITDTPTEWKKLTVPFQYSDFNTTPQKINVIFSANDYFDDTTVKLGTSLTIDNVKLIYHHALTSLTSNGTTYSIAEGVTSLDLSSEAYDEASFSYEKKGAGATVEKSYDAATHLLTLTVKGNDFAVNPASVTTYKVQYGAPGTLDAISINGADLVLEAKRFYYTVVGEYDAEKVAFMATDGDLVTVTTDYDAASRILTLQVKDGKCYRVKYAKETTDYEGKMLIGMSGSMLTASNESVGLSAASNEVCDFQLLDFSLFDARIGDIFVTDVPYAPEADGSVKIFKEQVITIFGDAAEGMGLINLPVVLNGELRNGELTAEITITWNELPIVVRIAPFSAPSIDASDMAGAGGFIEPIKQGMSNPNLLVYIPAGETVDEAQAANVVIGSEASRVTISDAAHFHAPKPFTAATVAYARTFPLSGLSTFVLPFATSAVEGKVYEFTGVTNGTTLNFNEVTSVEANKPYVFQAGTDAPFATVESVDFAATPATMENVQGSLAHVGTYETKQVASTSTQTYYGYAKGEFVKANTGTLKPFRTLFRAAGASTVEALAINLGDEITGITDITGKLPATVNVVSIDGRVIRTAVKPETALRGLPAGTYIVGGVKVVKN